METHYADVYEQIQAGLQNSFSIHTLFRKPQFKIKNNRMQIFLDQNKESHYEICFRRDYYEFVLHFESTPARSIARRQTFDPYLDEFTLKVGQPVRSGKHEDQGWMRVWFQLTPEPLDSQKAEKYTSLFTNFMEATLPILEKIYETDGLGR
jgi:hypothetical protein